MNMNRIGVREGQTAWRGLVVGLRSMVDMQTDCPYTKLPPGWVLRSSPGPESTIEKNRCQRVGGWEHQWLTSSVLQETPEHITLSVSVLGGFREHSDVNPRPPL